MSLPSRAEIDAVVLDIGGVFTLRSPELIVGALEGVGIAVASDHETHHRAHYFAVRAMTEAIARQDSAVNEYDPTFWRNYEQTHMRTLGVPDDRYDDAVKALIELNKRESMVWRRVLTENVEALRSLHDAGVPLAIVSNNNGTAEQQLREFGICQIGEGPHPSVQIIVDSGIAGIAKPDPAIFLPALQQLGTTPSRSLYVGDTVHADVHGAMAAGMPVVQLDPYDLHNDHEHLRAPDLQAIVNALLG
jgi:putative hydrolase of the HAD superfamily